MELNKLEELAKELGITYSSPEEIPDEEPAEDGLYEQE